MRRYGTEPSPSRKYMRVVAELSALVNMRRPCMCSFAKIWTTFPIKLTWLRYFPTQRAERFVYPTSSFSSNFNIPIYLFPFISRLHEMEGRWEKSCSEQLNWASEPSSTLATAVAGFSKVHSYHTLAGSPALWIAEYLPRHMTLLCTLPCPQSSPQWGVIVS